MYNGGLNDGITRHYERKTQCKTVSEQKIEENIRKELEACLDDCNKKSGLNIQIIYDEDENCVAVLANHDPSVEEQVIEL